MSSSTGSAIVSGATGFLGQYVTRELLARGYEVLILTRDARKSKDIFTSEKIAVIEGSFMDPQSLQFPKHADIFHCAGITGSIHSSQKAYDDINIQGTRNFLHLATKYQANTFNFVSSISAVGAQGHLRDPITEETKPLPGTYYGASKLAAEQVIKDFQADFPMTIIRPSLIYGPGQSERSGAGVLFRLCQNTLIPKLGLQPAVIPLVYVQNVAAGLIDLSLSHQGTEIFNVTDPTPCSIPLLTKTISELINKKSYIIHLPYVIGALCGFTADRVSKTLKRDIGLGSELIKNLGKSGSHMSIEKALRFGYQPLVSLEEGVRLTLERL